MFFVDLSLARRLEASSAWRASEYARAQSKLRPEIKSAIAPIAGGHAIYAGADAPGNRAIGLGLHNPVTCEDLEFVEDFYRSRGAIPGIHLCPLADASLFEQLKQRSYRLEKFFNVYVLSLSESASTTALSTEVRVTLVGPKERELWLQTVVQGFSEQDVLTPEMLKMIAPTLHSESAQCFLAWVDGEPAGGGAMLLHDGVAKLCSTSTRLMFRKKGVQTALLNARLAFGKEAGCDLAHVLISPSNGASRRNVERAGFRLAYTKAVMVKG